MAIMSEKEIQYDEINLKAKNGMGILILNIILSVAGVSAIIAGGIMIESGLFPVLSVVLLVVGILYTCICWIPFLGLKILQPQEALVLTLFGKYIGTLRARGFSLLILLYQQ
jgi:regulator of protease activity HflC (stomatin/prohibitin superfamily)